MSFEEGLKLANRGFEKLSEGNDLMNDALWNAFLFTWQWWLGMALFILPWLLWGFLRKKESTGRLLLAAFPTILAAIIIDSVALPMNKWSYPMQLIPGAPWLFLPYHFSLLPVAVMLMIQWKPRMSAFLKGVVLAVVGSYGMKPIFVKLGFYDPKGWPYKYDFLMILGLYFIGYWFSRIDRFAPLVSGEENV